MYPGLQWLPVVWDYSHVARRSVGSTWPEIPRTRNQQDPGIFGCFSSVKGCFFFFKAVKFSQFSEGTSIGGWVCLQPLSLGFWSLAEAKLAARQEFSSLPPAIRCLLDVETQKIWWKAKRCGVGFFGFWGFFFVGGGGLTKKEIAHVFSSLPVCQKIDSSKLA